MKQKKKKKETELPLAEIKRINKIRNRWFYAIIIALTLGLYGNSVMNYYNLDDYHVTERKELIEKGISAVPEIITSLYAEESGLSYGYRPLVRISFAIDHELFGGKRQLPYISHFINVFLYLISIILLFNILRRLFRNYHPYFPFLVTVLFLIHPLHTEVVASLKNRDEILTFLFALLALQQFMRWADKNKVKFLIFGSLFYMLALLSKTTALSFLLIFPLTMYFFSDIKNRRLLIFAGVTVFVTILAVVGPFIFLPEFSRNIRFMENPIVDEDFFTRISTGFYILLLYIKKLIFPLPMAYYYGYNMIPVKTFGSFWVIVSVLIYLGMFIYAIKKFREKHILSYSILFFLITIAMFANIVMPVPGIMGDRFMYFPSLAFAIFVVYFLYKLFNTDVHKKEISKTRISSILVVTAIIVIFYGAMVVDRNKDWRTKIDLYTHDLEYLQNSVKANDLLATELISQISRDAVYKPVNVIQFQMKGIKQAIKCYKRATKIYPKHYSSYYNLGFIYGELLTDYQTAISYYRKAIDYDPEYLENPYVMSHYYLGRAYQRIGKYDSAHYFFNKSFQLKPSDPRFLSSRVKLYFENEKIEEAMQLNDTLMNIYPEAAEPYINLGVYYFERQDTTQFINNFRTALMKAKGRYFSINDILFLHYRDKREWKTAEFFLMRLRDEIQRRQQQLQNSK